MKWDTSSTGSYQPRHGPEATKPRVMNRNLGAKEIIPSLDACSIITEWQEPSDLTDIFIFIGYISPHREFKLRQIKGGFILAYPLIWQGNFGGWSLQHSLLTSPETQHLTKPTTPNNIPVPANLLKIAQPNATHFLQWKPTPTHLKIPQFPPNSPSNQGQNVQTHEPGWGLFAFKPYSQGLGNSQWSFGLNWFLVRATSTYTNATFWFYLHVVDRGHLSCVSFYKGTHSIHESPSMTQLLFHDPMSKHHHFRVNCFSHMGVGSSGL